MIIYKDGIATFYANETPALSKLEQRKADLKNSLDKKRQERIDKANQKRDDYKNANA